MTELFIVLENGQLEVNFEALELKTSTEFVEYIQKRIECGKGNFVIKKVVEEKFRITVVALSHRYTMVKLNYWFNRGFDVNKDEKSIDCNDINLYMEIGGVVVNG